MTNIYRKNFLSLYLYLLSIIFMKKVYKNENLGKFHLRYTDLFICIFSHGYFITMHLVYPFLSVIGLSLGSYVLFYNNGFFLILTSSRKNTTNWIYYFQGVRISTLFLSLLSIFLHQLKIASVNISGPSCEKGI